MSVMTFIYIFILVIQKNKFRVNKKADAIFDKHLLFKYINLNDCCVPYILLNFKPSLSSYCFCSLMSSLIRRLVSFSVPF